MGLEPNPESYVRFEMVDRTEVTPGVGWEWGEIGWALQNHKGMDWFSVWGIFYVFIFFLLRELLPLELLCYIYCIARASKDTKWVTQMQRMLLADTLWELKPTVYNQREAHYLE